MFIVQIAGRLGKDPETRFTPSGQKVTTFNVATNHRKGKEDVTIWVRVTIWGDRFDKMLSYLKKGSAVIVAGRMNPPSSYTDKDGRSQVSLEVTAEMLEFSPFGSDRPMEGQPAQQGYHQTQHQDYGFNGEESAGGYSRAATGQGSGALVDEDTLPF